MTFVTKKIADWIMGVTKSLYVINCESGIQNADWITGVTKSFHVINCESVDNKIVRNIQYANWIAEVTK